MSWLTIGLLLACPLMMFLCMRGMSGGHKNAKPHSDHDGVSQKELQELQISMADLMEQNHRLSKEVQSLKENASNVIELEEEKNKRVIS